MRAAILLIFLSIPFSFLTAQQATGPTQGTSTPHQASAAKAPSFEDLQALREDLQKMKALVQQMQTNLAFVTSTQGPLKHQFELEIEMWQLEIARMERKLGQSSEDGTRK